MVWDILELLSFPGYLPCTQKVYKLLNFWVFFLLICLLLQGSLCQEPSRKIVIFFSPTLLVFFFKWVTLVFVFFQVQSMVMWLNSTVQIIYSFNPTVYLTSMQLRYCLWYCFRHTSKSSESQDTLTLAWPYEVICIILQQKFPTLLKWRHNTTNSSIPKDVWA